MGFNDERYFFLSGTIAFGFFIFLVALIGFTLVSPSKIEQFALTQSQYVSISLDMATPRPSIKPEPKPKPQVQQEQPVPPEEVKQNVEQPQSAPDISDLFSKVKPEKMPKKTEDTTKKLEALNALEKQVSSHTKNTPQFTDKVKNTVLVTPSVKIVSKSGSTGPLVNEYHAKIQALIYANYFPPSGTQGQSARVRIYLDALGRLTGYRVMGYSGNTLFNSEVDSLKERLRGVSFPINPDGKDSVIEIILTAKE